MKIALVGGLVRREAELARLAHDAGHRLEWHCGDVGGRRAEGLKAVIERADVVVILTEINSHGSMYLAKKVARQLGRKTVVLRKCGPAMFEALLAELGESGSLPGAPKTLLHRPSTMQDILRPEPGLGSPRP